MNNSLKKAMPVVLSIAAGVGTLATAALTARATYKTSDVWGDDTINIKTKIKKTWKSYILPAGVCVGTIASLTTAAIMSKKTEATLTAAIVGAEQTYQKYRNAVEKTVGKETAKRIDDAMAIDYIKEKLETGEGDYYCFDENPGDKIIIFEPTMCKFIETTPYILKDAELAINRGLQTDCAVTVYDFYKHLGILLNDEDRARAENTGWSLDNLICDYGMYSVEFDFRRNDNIDGMTIYTLLTNLEPIHDPQNYSASDAFYSNDGEVIDMKSREKNTAYNEVQ